MYIFFFTWVSRKSKCSNNASVQSLKTAAPNHAYRLRNLHGHAVHQCYQILYCRINALNFWLFLGMV